MALGLDCSDRKREEEEEGKGREGEDPSVPCLLSMYQRGSPWQFRSHTKIIHLAASQCNPA